MLVEFSVRNFRSIKGRATLSMAATPSREMRDRNVFSAGAKGVSLLASAALYGANASGKSSVLLAMYAMRQIVTRTHQRGDALPVEPYLFDTDLSSSPSEFEVTFYEGGVQYQYGFSATRQKVHSEWLFAFPKGRPQRWIVREWDESAKRYEMSISEKVAGTRSLWMGATRDNALLLSTAVQLNCVQFTPVYDWFRTMVRVLRSDATFPDYTGEVCMEEGGKKRVLSFLQAADFDISDIQVSSEEFDPSKLPEDMPETVKEQIKEHFKDRNVLDIKMVHAVGGGVAEGLDLGEESDGTQKLFGLIGPWLDVLEDGMTLFVDELHGSLHPHLVRLLVEMFHDPKINRNGAQLIFTTHDTAILSQHVFRRDQIWFTEKTADSGTRLFPLTDFSPRKGAEDIRTHYLGGRYGAVPYLSEVYSAFGAERGQ